ncbi:MAG: NFACT RNA binding domain-containing protein [Nanoarchaeota archaeon]|nr:NFACT RNA binding domain-containing protein [Nanoarchaeota archaeon]
MVKLDLFLDKTVEQNAALYFEKSKKLKKKTEGAQIAIKVQQKKLAELLKKREAEQEKFQKRVKKVAVKHEWYEKFRWFTTSEGFLVIGGRDATTNEMVIKKYTDSTDIIFHTDLAGSPFFVIKAEGKPIGEASIREVADATVTFSRVFKLGQSNSPVFWVKPEQVTKEANTGEYLTKGAFVIRGKTNYIENRINLAVGKLSDGRLMAAPLECVKAHCKEFVQLEQGDDKVSKIAKSIQKKLGGDLDEIIRILPSGEFRFSKTR